MRISIIGSGAWGTAIAVLLDANGHEVTLWFHSEKSAAEAEKTRDNPRLPGVKIPERVKISSDLAAAAAGAEMIVIAVPSFALRETAMKLKGLIPDNCTIVCISKGIEKDSAMLFSQILREIFGEDAKIASLSGPSHAEEVGRGIPTACVAASGDEATALLVQDVFMSPVFRVYTSDDIIGVELGAALKNVIALSVGVCEGLGYGDNTKAMLMTRGLNEMATLCVALGGRKETLAGLAGLGDLIVTCTSPHSRNRRAGVLIGKGLSVEEAMGEVGAVVEGYYAARAAMDLKQKAGISMPIFEDVYAVLYVGKDIGQSLCDLMARNRKPENTDGTGKWVMK